MAETPSKAMLAAGAAVLTCMAGGDPEHVVRAIWSAMASVRAGKERIVSERQASVPYSEVVELFHTHCAGLPRVQVMTAARRSTIRSRWLDVSVDFQKDPDPTASTLDWWAWYFQRVASSDFLMGRGSPFRASFDWIMNPSNFAKVLEGNYHKGQK